MAMTAALFLLGDTSNPWSIIVWYVRSKTSFTGIPIMNSDKKLAAAVVIFEQLPSKL